MIPKDEDAKQFAIMACKPFCHFPKDGSQVPFLGTLKEDDTVESILRRLYDVCLQDGINLGKTQKQEEIKKALGIEIDD